MLQVEKKKVPSFKLVALLQLLWWTTFAVVLGSVTYLKSMGSVPLTELVLLSIIWMGVGLALSTLFLFVSVNFWLSSWTRGKQILAGLFGIVLGTVTFSGFFLSILQDWPVEGALIDESSPPRSMPIVAGSFYTHHPSILKSVEGTWGAPGVTFDLVVYDAFVFSLWTLAAMLVGEMQRNERMEQIALRAHSEKTAAELDFVRQRVNAHLVFNVLNSILAAIEDRSPKAGEMVMDLSCLLRQSLETMPHMGTLGDELGRLSLYSKIEKSRFEEDLDIQIDIPEALRSMPCLPMVVQPLLENAVKHGFAQKIPPIRIEVRGEYRSGHAIVRVINDGTILAAETARVGDDSQYRGGVGLRSVRRRLQLAYGDEASVELKEDNDGETARVVATISWPVYEEVS